MVKIVIFNKRKVTILGQFSITRVERYLIGILYMEMFCSLYDDPHQVSFERKLPPTGHSPQNLEEKYDYCW